MSVASFYHQGAARVQYMLINFYLLDSNKNSNNSTTTWAGEEIRKLLESFESLKIFNGCLSMLENNQIELHKFGHRFLVKTKQCTEWNIPINCFLKCQMPEKSDKKSIKNQEFFFYQKL